MYDMSNHNMGGRTAESGNFAVSAGWPPKHDEHSIALRFRHVCLWFCVHPQNHDVTCQSSASA